MKSNTPLHNLLIGSPTQSGLFASQSELARCIVRGVDPQYENCVLTRSLVQQVLVGRRKCPRKLANAILGVVRERYKDVVVQEVKMEIEYHNQTVVPELRASASSSPAASECCKAALALIEFQIEDMLDNKPAREVRKHFEELAAMQAERHPERAVGSVGLAMLFDRVLRSMRLI